MEPQWAALPRAVLVQRAARHAAGAHPSDLASPLAGLLLARLVRRRRQHRQQRGGGGGFVQRLHALPLLPQLPVAPLQTRHHGGYVLHGFGTAQGLHENLQVVQIA